MIKLFSIISIILLIALFPPAVLALVSNNAVPGDATYPIKRSLEDGIYAIASLNPVSKAWFAQARSDRRFKEFSALVAEGKAASETVNELVSQTDIAADEITKIEDPVKKQELADKLIESIQKYDQGLEQASTQVTSKQVASKPAETPVPVTSGPTTMPSVPQPSPTIVAATPAPVSTSAPTPRPTQTPHPQVTPQPTTQPHLIVAPSTPSTDAQAIEEARKKMEEIKKKIEEEKSKQKTNQKVPELTPNPGADKINKKGDEGDSHSGAGAKSEPVGNVKTKNEK